MNNFSRRGVLISAALASCLFLSACGGGVESPHEMQARFDFNGDVSGWEGGYSDYSDRTEPYEVTLGSRVLPSPFSGNGLYMSGTNRSDDLYLFIKHKLNGFAPNNRYRLNFKTEILTRAPSGCSGVGGGPDSVWVKAGASVMEPAAIKVGSDVVMNVDKGEQSERGISALVLGDIGNSSSNCEPPYESKHLSSDAPLEVVTDSGGTLWLFYGIDSGFEGTNSIYVKSISVNAVPASLAQ